MLSPEKIERINELARKKKENGLSKAEEQEQINLRKEYLEAFRSGMRHHIEGMKEFETMVSNSVLNNFLF